MFNSSKFNQLKFNSKYLVKKLVELQTGSGISKKKRRTRLLYKEFDIDGIKRFSFNKEFNIVAKKIITLFFKYVVYGKLNLFKSFYYSINGKKKSYNYISRNLLGINKSLTQFNYSLEASKRFNFYSDKPVFGSLKSSFENRYSLLAKKSFNRIQEYDLKATKEIYTSSEKLIKGRKDILPILVALNLISSEEILYE